MLQTGLTPQQCYATWELRHKVMGRWLPLASLVQMGRKLSQETPDSLYSHRWRPIRVLFTHRYQNKLPQFRCRVGTCTAGLANSCWQHSKLLLAAPSPGCPLDRGEGKQKGLPWVGDDLAGVGGEFTSPLAGTAEQSQQYFDFLETP